MPERYVALGDSFTEGVGDWNPRFPNGVRGWADRVAKQLSKNDPTIEYANLAIRSKRLAQIRDEQLEAAIAMNPTLVTLYAGGNDILEVRNNMDTLMAGYQSIVRTLRSTGARVLLFTGFDVPLHPALEPLKRRNWVYNANVRRIAIEEGAEVIDYWCFEEFHDRRLWDVDRLHMSSAGHRVLAAHVLAHIGVPHTISPPAVPDPAPPGMRAWVRREREWLGEWVLPMFGRRLRGVTLGDSLEAKWPEPIRPADGMKKMARRRVARK